MASGFKEMTLGDLQKKYEVVKITKDKALLKEREEKAKAKAHKEKADQEKDKVDKEKEDSTMGDSHINVSKSTKTPTAKEREQKKAIREQAKEKKHEYVAQGYAAAAAKAEIMIVPTQEVKDQMSFWVARMPAKDRKRMKTECGWGKCCQRVDKFKHLEPCNCVCHEYGRKQKVNGVPYSSEEVITQMDDDSPGF
jgi:hypothetical protein